jgi:peptide/nickel transport system substrate-binding protein
VQPREIWELPNTTAVDYISSTGPYKFVEWLVGDRVIMERWEDYQPRTEKSSYMAGGHTAYIDRVEWLEVPDFATRVAALTTGQVDWVDEYPSDFASRVEKSAKAVFTTGKPGRLVGMWPSHTHPPFDNQRVRQAVQMAMDNDKILGIAAGGPKGQFWDTCSGFMGCGINQTVWDSTGVPGTELYNIKDVETAKKIVEEEGMKGVEIRLTSPEDLAMFKDTTRPFKELLEQLGFVVDFQATDWGTVAALYNDPDSFDLGITGTKLGYNVSPLQFDWFLTSDGARNGYSDPTGNMTKYFNQMARESDFAAIKAISDKVHAQFYEDVPMFYFGQQTWANGRSARIKNFANKHTPFWPNAWLEN